MTTVPLHERLAYRYPVAAPDGTAGIGATTRQRGNIRAWRAAEFEAASARRSEAAAAANARGDKATAALNDRMAFYYSEDARSHRERAYDYYRAAEREEQG